VYNLLLLPEYNFHAGKVFSQSSLIFEDSINFNRKLFNDGYDKLEIEEGFPFSICLDPEQVIK
jgi:hypothetical protein